MLKDIRPNCIIVPDKYFSNFLTDFYYYLSSIFNEAIPNSTIIKTSQFVPSSRFETLVVISFAHWQLEDMKKLENTSKNTKLIFWHDDMQWLSDEAKRINEYLFERAELIIHGSKYTYLDIWNNYQNKSYWLPLFAPPYFHQEFNPSPKLKCLLAGHDSSVHYPLRNFIKRANSKFVESINHPGYAADSRHIVRKKYAEHIRSYFCSVTDSGKCYGAFKYKISGEKRTLNIDDYLTEKMGQDKLETFKTKGQVLLKYFEIPASGSLLIADDNIPEIKEIGYQPNVNYMSVNEVNVLDVIEDCCMNHQKYEEIRYNGWILAKQHTIEERAKQLKEILKCY